MKALIEVKTNQYFYDQKYLNFLLEILKYEKTNSKKWLEINSKITRLYAEKITSDAI